MKIGLSNQPARLGIDSWAPEKVNKYGLWARRGIGKITTLNSLGMMCVYACNSWFNYCKLVPNGHFVLSMSCCVVPLRNVVFASCAP